MDHHDTIKFFIHCVTHMKVLGRRFAVTLAILVILRTLAPPTSLRLLLANTRTVVQFCFVHFGRRKCGRQRRSRRGRNRWRRRVIVARIPIGDRVFVFFLGLLQTSRCDSAAENFERTKYLGLVGKDFSWVFIFVEDDESSFLDVYVVRFAFI